jgi:hypothetical protein
MNKSTRKQTGFEGHSRLGVVWHRGGSAGRGRAGCPTRIVAASARRWEFNGEQEGNPVAA